MLKLRCFDVVGLANRYKVLPVIVDEFPRATSRISICFKSTFKVVLKSPADVLNKVNNI